MAKWKRKFGSGRFEQPKGSFVISTDATGATRRVRMTKAQRQSMIAKPSELSLEFVRLCDEATSHYDCTGRPMHKAPTRNLKSPANA